jgi:hypothetical protein
MRVILIQSKFCGHLMVREVEAHKVQAQHPPPQGLMMTGKDGVSQIVEASFTGRAQRALTLGLGVIVPLFGHLRLSNVDNAPSGQRGRDSLKTFGGVDGDCMCIIVPVSPDYRQYRANNPKQGIINSPNPY